MGKTYRAWDVDQVWLLPPSVHDFVPRESPGASDPGAWCGKSWTCRRSWRLRAGAARLSALPPGDDGGAAAVCLQPRRLLVAADARACEERLDFMAVTACSGRTSAPSATSASAISRPWRSCSCRCWRCAVRPGWSSSATWRWTAPSCRPTPRRHKAMSYGRMKQARAELAAEVERLAGAGGAGRRGRGCRARRARGDEMPALAGGQAAAAGEDPRRPRRRWRPKPRPSAAARTTARGRGRPRA